MVWLTNYKIGPSGIFFVDYQKWDRQTCDISMKEIPEILIYIGFQNFAWVDLWIFSGKLYYFVNVGKSRQIYFAAFNLKHI
jgi:hypothetical protein